MFERLKELICDRRARLYARGAACYPRRLAKVADMIYPKYPPVMNDVPRALQAGILLRCVSSTGRASGS